MVWGCAEINEYVITQKLIIKINYNCILKNSFETRKLDVHNHNQVIELINIPINLKEFLFKYNHSKFLECYQNLPNFDPKIIEYNGEQYLEKNKSIRPHIKYLKKYFESMYKNFWIVSGTLLGKSLFRKIIKNTYSIFLQDGLDIAESSPIQRTWILA